MTPAQLLVKGAITHVQDSTKGGGGGVRVGGFRIGGKGGKGEVNATIYVVDSTTGQVLASTSVVGESTQKGMSLGYSGAGWGGDVGGFKNDNVGKAVEAACAEAVDFITAQLPIDPVDRHRGPGQGRPGLHQPRLARGRRSRPDLRRRRRPRSSATPTPARCSTSR